MKKQIDLRIVEMGLNLTMFAISAVLATGGVMIGMLLRPWRARRILREQSDYLQTEWAMTIGWYPTEQSVIAGAFIIIGILVVWGVAASLHSDPATAYGRSMGPSGCISADARQYHQALFNPCCEMIVSTTVAGAADTRFRFSPERHGCGSSGQ